MKQILNNGLFTDGEVSKKVIALRDIYGAPPFSVINGGDKSWIRRKAEWKSLGIQSEIGRGTNLTYTTEKLLKYTATSKQGTEESDIVNTSVFDPALCETLYTWFCPPCGHIIDPFAGGSVRGIVSHYLGFKYTGIDIRDEQIQSNIQQGVKILHTSNQPAWICGDSAVILPTLCDKYDFVFTCPPYGNLEVYSDLSGDISNKPYDTFLEMYSNILNKATAVLKKNRFVCIVVANFRDKKTGNLYDLVGDTTYIMKELSYNLYNEIIYLQPIGTARLRANHLFKSKKKLCKVHQNILVYYNGDVNNIWK